MNFDSERNKPIFISRSTQITLCNAREAINESLLNRTVLRTTAAYEDEYLIKAAAARNLPQRALIKIDDARPEEVKQLVISRLESDRDEKFEFLDGTKFSGAEAAAEVRRDSKAGKYFIELEKETLRIVQEAFIKGDFKY